MTDEKEVRDNIVNAFLKTLKVTKTFDAVSGAKGSTSCPEIRLEDFTISFSIPYSTCVNSTSDKDHAKVTCDFRLRTPLAENQVIEEVGTHDAEFYEAKPKNKQNQPLKCGNCDYWQRGGYGAGRGGGLCRKWKISKVASNTCGTGEGGCHSTLEKLR